MSVRFSMIHRPGRLGRVMPEIWRRFAMSEHGILWLSVFYALVLAPFTPGFLSVGNLGNLLLALLPLLLVAIGQTIVLIAGGIDLSVTSIIALSSVMGAMVMSGDDGWLAGHLLAVPAAVLVMLCTGALVGLVNGIAVAVLRMPAFIVTLTTMMFFGGLAVWSTKSANIGNLPAEFVVMGGRLWWALIIVGVVAGFAHVMLSRSLWGRWLYALGQNARAARVSGVPVGAVTLSAYVVCGVFAALASVLYSGQAETGSPVLGQRVLLDVIGATILGGTSLFGGKGKIVGTFCGVLFLKLVDNSLNLLNLTIFTITMVKGSVILAAAVLDVARVRIAEARP